MKILFLLPLHEKIDSLKKRSFFFPYGIGYLGSILEKNGYQVEVLDAHASQLTKEAVMQELSQREFDILGISAFSTQYNAVKKIALFVKNQLNKKVIVGGPLATYSYELTLKNCPVDVCVIGEGENTIIELLNNLNYPEKYQQIKGIAFKANGQIIRTLDRDYINLDDLPRPAYHLFAVERYLRASLYSEVKFGQMSSHQKYFNKKIICFITSRGCPYHCRFCSRNYRLSRHMSNKKIIEELKYLKDHFSIEGVMFEDELFVLNKERMREFVALLKELKLVWAAQARVNLVDYEMLKIMKEGGCVSVGFGIESGSQKILDNMDKRITVKQIEAAMTNAKKLKLGVKVQLIFGYPGENEETIKETIAMFKRIDHPGRRFNLITPIPGSPLYQECLAKGLILDEEAYLTNIEKSFSQDRVQLNFTSWSNEELLKKMRQTYQTIRDNYHQKYLYRYLIWKAKNLYRRLRPIFSKI